jgi:hypothetical protein
VPSVGVVQRFDPFEDRLGQFCPGLSAAAVEEFELEGPEEAFGHGVDAPVCQEGSSGGFLSVAVVGDDPLVDLSSNESFKAADDVSFGEPFGGAAGDVVDGGLVVSHPDDDGPVDGGVGLSVSSQ